MILRKPYAFFIKIFKPIHLFMAVLTTYLIFNTNKILSFFSEYIHSSNDVVGRAIREELILNSLYVIPIVIILFSLIFIGIIFSKKKTVVFYIINVLAFLIVLIITIYISNFLAMMEEAIVSIKIVKLSHDLVLINMIIEVLLFILLLIRGLGLNFKKFNFESDISKLNINESDKEEFELSISVDFNSAKTNRKRKLRHLKYFYNENKLLVNLSVLVCTFVITGVVLYFIFNANSIKNEGVVYNIKNFSIVVNNTFLIDKGVNGEKITDNYLIVADVSLKSTMKNVSLFLKDFTLEVENNNFKINTKYAQSLADIGIIYDESHLGSEFENYIFVFEIPKKYVEGEMLFIYNNEGVKTYINIEPKELVRKNVEKIKMMSEQINFNESLGDISFNIKSFDLKDKFIINYNYCIAKDDCLNSKEYIKPSIDKNFDKYVLKLELDYLNSSDLSVDNFYKLLSNFGTISYKIEDIWYLQKSDFEEIKSKKTENKNIVYIGVNSAMANANSIKLIFNIRDSKYEYILK